MAIGLQRTGVRPDQLAGFRPFGAGRRYCRVPPARTPLRRIDRPDRIVSNHRDGGETGKFASKLGSANNLVLRATSAAALGPLVLVFAYSGGWLFFLLCAAAAAGILWEWTGLVADGADKRIL